MRKPKTLTPRFQVCVYRHCDNEFRPKREAQRFCSQRCRDAYRYDTTRANQGHKKARKRHLGAAVHSEARKRREKDQQKQ